MNIILFGDYARKYLITKLAHPALAKKTKAVFRSQLEPGKTLGSRPRLLEAFGHLFLDVIDNEAWLTWVNATVAMHGVRTFFNARKALIEILTHAYQAGKLDRVPKLDLIDESPAPPRELTKSEILKLFRAAHWRHGSKRVRNWIKLLMLIAYKQGARPGEILQYQWGMVNWDNFSLKIPGHITKTRRARIIPLNRSVIRVLRLLRPHANGPYFFPMVGTLNRPIYDYQKAWRGVCKRAGFHAQFYWFRDSFISRKLKEGVGAIFIARYVDNSIAMIEKNYAVLDTNSLRGVAK